MSRVLQILFNTEMVRAVLDGRKTVTRRKIDIDISNQFDVDHDGKTVVAYIDQATGDSYDPKEICRYQPGDILYVRETWCNANKDGTAPDYYYFADTYICEDYRAEEWKWHPSIHMPKEAARIWLKVTDVRVERLQEITIDGCEEEGCWCGHNGDIFAFMALWDAAIRKADIKRYGWAANPWVWVIEFERCGKPES